MTDKSFTQGDMVFDEDGQAYEFVAHVEGVGTVVRYWYEYHDDDGAPYDRIGGPAVLQGPIFPEAPSPKRAAEIDLLDEKIAAKRNELTQIEQALREANAGRDAMLKRIKENEALRRIDAFLAGEITHYVLCGEYSAMDIIAVGDTAPEYAERGELRLLSLTASMAKSWNSKEATVRWDLNRYSDGSGNNTTCVPCTSLDDAKQVLGDLIAQRFALWESGKEKSYISYTASAAKKFGLPIPQRYLDQEAETLRAHAEAELKRCRAALDIATAKAAAAAGASKEVAA